MDRDLESALAATASEGFVQSELVAQPPHFITPPKGQMLYSLRSYLKKLGLSCTVHAPLGRNVLGAPEESWRQDAVKVFTDYLYFAAAVGATILVIHSIPNPIFVEEPEEPTLSERIYTAARRSLDELGPISSDTGIRILLENLPYRCFYPLKTMASLRDFVALYPENIGLVIDTGHAAVLENNPAEEIKLAGKRLYGTHLHDIDTAVQERYDNHWVPGDGGLNWSSIRQALQRIAYN